MLAILVKQLERPHRDVNNHKSQVSLRYSSLALRTYQDPAVVEIVAMENWQHRTSYLLLPADIVGLVKDNCVLVRRLRFDVGYYIL